MEKIAAKIIEETDQLLKANKKKKKEKIFVNQENLVRYLGQPNFSEYELYKELEPGVVKGLAYSGYGGSVLYIETQSVFQDEGQKAEIQFSGNLGDVMKESIQIAYSYARNLL